MGYYNIVFQGEIRMKLNTKIAILFIAAMLVMVPTAVTVYGHYSGRPAIGRLSGGSHNFNRTLKPRVVSILMVQGFALNPSDESQYHVLDVTAMTVSNSSQSQTRGNIKFEGQPYGLTITGYTNTSLIGNIETLPPSGTNHTGFTPTQVGNITLSISKYEGVMLSTGTITMNSTSYNVLLRSPVVGSGARHNFNGMFGPHNFNGTLRPHFNGAFKPHKSNGILG
jgi:hypothetical protein